MYDLCEGAGLREIEKHKDPFDFAQVLTCTTDFYNERSNPPGRLTVVLQLSTNVQLYCSHLILTAGVRHQRSNVFSFIVAMHSVLFLDTPFPRKVLFPVTSASKQIR